MPKSNIELLKESLSAKNEWLVAVEAEIIDKDAEIRDLEEKVKRLEQRETELEENQITEDTPICNSVIDFGLAKLHYKTSENLKVNMYMEDLAEKVKSSF